MIKRILGLLVLLASGIAPGEVLAGVTLISNDAQQIVLEFRLVGLRLETVEQDGTSVQRVSFEGCAYTTEEGLPRLPLHTALIGIPAEGEVQGTVLSSRSRRIAVGALETVPRRVLSRNAAGEIVGGWEAYRRSDLPALYPAKLVQAGRPGFLRDQRVLPIRFYPVQYDANAGTLRVHDAIRVAVRWSGGRFAPAQERPAPESPIYERTLRSLLLNYEQARQWRQPRRALPAAPAPYQGPPSPAIKIGLVQEGMYHLTYRMLKEAGVPLEDVDPRTFKLFHQGRPVPIFVRGEYDRRFDPQDEIVFYGQRLRGEKTYYHPYTFENVYWLTWGGSPGQRMVKRSIDVPVERTRRYTKYRFRVHAEEDRSFVRLSEVNQPQGGNYIPIRGGVFQRAPGGTLKLPDLPEDSWFWEVIPSSSVREFSLYLPGVAATSLNAAVRVMMHGLTTLPVQPDHHTVIWINGERQLDDATWDGQVPYFFETTELSQDFLKPGENRLIVMAPGDTPAREVDQVLFNWCEIDYWRVFEAEDDVLEFSIPATSTQPFNVLLSNFTSPDVEIFGVDGSLYGDNLVIEDERRPGTYLVRFIGVPEVRDPLDPTVQYIALTRDRFLEPKWVKMDTPSALRSPTNGADYLVIAHPSLAGGVQPLLDWRESQGWRVMLVTTEDIYDEFSGGVFDPEAIRRFLAYAYQHWSPPAPSYVLLVGDASTHYRTDVNYVPTLLVQTPKYGAAASDHRFVTIQGDDDLPDMAIGRLPVRNLVDLNVIIQKILNYERSPERGPWRRNLLFLGGAGHMFAEQTERLIQDYVPPEFQVQRVFADDPQSEYYGGTREVIRRFSEGSLLVNFIGHGGGSIWSDNRMLGLEDVALLSNGQRLPFVLSMTCFTGYFDNPFGSSLGEEMLRVPDRGAVAFFGDTGLGWLLGDFYLSRYLYERLFRAQQYVLGEMIAQAKTLFLVNYPDYTDLAEMFTLLGDPVLRLGIPTKQIALQALPVVERNSVLPVSGAIGGGFEGEVELLLTDGQGKLLDAARLEATGGAFQAQLSISSLASAGVGMIRAYAWNAEEDAIGATSYAIDTPHVGDVRLVGEPVLPGSTPQVTAQVVSPGGVAEVHVAWSSDQQNWQSIPMTPIGNDRYRTLDPMPARFAGERIYYQVVVTDHRGVQGRSPMRSYQVRNFADLSFGTEGVTQRSSVPPALAAVVMNKGQVPAENVLVRFYEGEATPEHLIGEVTLSRLEPGEKREAVVLWQPSRTRAPEGIPIQVVLDPEGEIQEANERNNVLNASFVPNRFVVTPLKGTGGTVISADGNLYLEIPGGVARQEAVLVLDRVASVPIEGQPDLHYLSPDAVNYQIALLVEGEEQPGLRGQITVPAEALAPSADVSRIGVYYYDTLSQRWIRTEGTLLSDGSLTGTLIDSGRYAVLQSTDRTPPEITLTVEHQGFIDNSYVSSTPVISAVIRDDNGVNAHENSLQLFLDGKAIPRTEYALESVGNQVFLSFAPTLEPGAHSVTLQVNDASGNLGTAEARMQVAEELEIAKVANFPNPFVPGPKERRLGTTFAYVLTGEADRVTLKIYTVTGHLITTLEGLDTSPDYNEYHWNGLDAEGNELPNGAYLYQFIAESGGKKAKKVGKLAILR